MWRTANGCDDETLTWNNGEESERQRGGGVAMRERDEGEISVYSLFLAVGTLNPLYRSSTAEPLL
jgi:hypothetical protein